MWSSVSRSRDCVKIFFLPLPLLLECSARRARVRRYALCLCSVAAGMITSDVLSTRFHRFYIFFCESNFKSVVFEAASVFYILVLHIWSHVQHLPLFMLQDLQIFMAYISTFWHQLPHPLSIKLNSAMADEKKKPNYLKQAARQIGAGGSAGMWVILIHVKFTTTISHIHTF